MSKITVMVFGSGMVAKRFRSYQTNNDFLIFASGVSNSKVGDLTSYKREIELLATSVKKNLEKTVVYFSSCCLYDPVEKDSAYTIHKMQIENFIQAECKNYNIFRVSHLAGKSENKNTLLNFFVYHAFEGINFDLWKNTSRNIIDIDDAYKIIDYILQNKLLSNQIVNIASPFNYTTTEIADTIEKNFAIKANYTEIEKGISFKIDTSLIQPIGDLLKIEFDKNYLEKLLKKYYPGKSDHNFSNKFDHKE
jgi:nucleoside-diphosphate-sugar epimerase